MMNNLLLYPTLTEELAERVKISVSSPSFFYNFVDIRKGMRVGIEKEIELSIDSPHLIEMKDEGGRWDPKRDTLIIKQRIKLDQASELFDSSGIVSRDVKIGLGVVWYSRESRQRGSKNIGTVSFDSNKKTYDMELVFDKAQIRDKLNYEIIMFVSNIDKSYTGFKANEFGLIIGTIFETTLILDGVASSFPIVSIEDPSKPLWSLACSWADIDDPFEENIMLRLNKSHKDYDLLTVEGPKYNDYLFKQILVSVVVQIVSKAVENNDIQEIVESNNLQVGTVGYLIKYYINVFDIKYDTITNIFDSVMLSVWEG